MEACKTRAPALDLRLSHAYAKSTEKMILKGLKQPGIFYWEWLPRQVGLVDSHRKLPIDDHGIPLVSGEPDRGM